MRERIFKAKRKNWKELPKEQWWVEGAIFEGKENSYIITNVKVTDEWEDSEIGADVIGYLVDHETICEPTGMTDKNGKKIFENDIVHDVESWHPSENGIVKFGIGTFSSGIHQYTGWVVEDKDGKSENSPLYQYEKSNEFEICGYVVVGNIFDNPELINANGGGKDE